MSIKKSSQVRFASKHVIKGFIQNATRQDLTQGHFNGVRSACTNQDTYMSHKKMIDPFSIPLYTHFMCQTINLALLCR